MRLAFLSGKGWDMRWFEGFPFITKEEQERRRKEFEKRVAPFGIEEQREKLKATLLKLFPKTEITYSMFMFYDAKDAFTKEETSEKGLVAAQRKLRRNKVDSRTETIILRLIELESVIDSLDDYPAAQDVLAGLFDED